MLKWFDQACSGKATYLMKTDDDMYVNLDNLLDLVRHNKDPYLMTGEVNAKYVLAICFETYFINLPFVRVGDMRSQAHQGPIQQVVFAKIHVRGESLSNVSLRNR